MKLLYDKLVDAVKACVGDNGLVIKTSWEGPRQTRLIFNDGSDEVIVTIDLSYDSASAEREGE